MTITLTPSFMPCSIYTGSTSEEYATSWKNILISSKITHLTFKAFHYLAALLPIENHFQLTFIRHTTKWPFSSLSNTPDSVLPIIYSPIRIVSFILLSTKPYSPKFLRPGCSLSYMEILLHQPMLIIFFSYFLRVNE